MAVRWHYLPEHFTAKEKTFQLTLPAERKKIKIAEEENGLGPDRAHACHLDLRLMP